MSLFRSVNLTDLQSLLGDCEVRDVVEGEVLIEQGQPNDRLYLLLSGEVGIHLESADSLPIATLEKGQVFGELSLIDHRPTSAFVVACKPSRVLVVSECTLWDLVSASHGIALNLLRTLSSRLRSDHTLIHKHREQLRQAHKLEALGHLAGGIAHNFNNLLALAMMDLHTIAELARGDARIVELAQEARRVLQSGADLTRQLLAFARRRQLESRTVDVNQLVEATVVLLRQSLDERIEIRTRLKNGRCVACVDPAQLESALLNLALNARDAMPDGGILTLTTSHKRAGRAPAADSFAVVTVEDTGHGMTAEVMERAFEPLFTTKGPEAGTGLGLSMVYGFVKQSGGSVTLSSKVGHGTKVTLCLPVPLGGADGERRRQAPPSTAAANR